MPRCRGLKPDFFLDEDLAHLPYEGRLLFEGLWCLADREGRLEDRPKYIKAQIFPYDNVNIERLLKMLCEPQIEDRQGKVFIRRYTVDKKQFIDIPEFLKHQTPHHTEKPSQIPHFNGCITVKEPSSNGVTPPSSLLEANSKQLTVNSKQYERFLIFYSAYPKKKDKQTALKIWKKLNPNDELLGLMLKSISAQKKSDDWLKDNGSYIPYPATWLNGHRWEDETSVEVVHAKPRSTYIDYEKEERDRELKRASERQSAIDSLSGKNLQD